jgi:CheY-like chemotaxis protein
MANRMFVLVGEKGAKEASEVTEVFRQFDDITFHVALGGDEVIQYLQGDGRFVDRNAYPFPSWMILNMKMPGRPALDVIKWLRGHPECNVVPAILMCESCTPQDIKLAYDLGVCTVFKRPDNIEEAKKHFAMVKHYWEMAAAPVLAATHKCP